MSATAQPIDIAGDALRLIAGDECERLTPGRCSAPNSGYERGGRYGADAWCDACIAYDALTRMDNGEAPTPSRETILADRLREVEREHAELRAATARFGQVWERLAGSAELILRIEDEIKRAVALAALVPSRGTPETAGEQP